MKNFKYSTQTISKKDIINVNKVLKSDFLTQGPKTIEFERKIKSLEAICTLMIWCTG